MVIWLPASRLAASAAPAEFETSALIHSRSENRSKFSPSNGCSASLAPTMGSSHNLEPVGGTMSYQQYPQQQAYQAGAGEPPLWAPYYGAPFPVAVRRFFKKYATFSGRASRSEYWWWVLVAAVVGIIINVITASGVRREQPWPPTVLQCPVRAPRLASSCCHLGTGNHRAFPGLDCAAPARCEPERLVCAAGSRTVPWGIALLVLTILPSKPEGQRFDAPTA